MSYFDSREYKDWFLHPITQDVLKDLQQFRDVTFEAILCTSRGERVDVSFRVEGMDLMLNKLKEKGE